MAMSVSQSVSQGSGIGKLTIIASIERLQSEDHSLDDLHCYGELDLELELELELECQ